MMRDMNSKPLILQVYWYFETVSGDFHYRIRQPGNALHATGHAHVVNIHIFHPLFGELALNADLLILHLLPDSEIETLIRLRRERGLPTVFEIGDHIMCPGPWVPQDSPYRNPLIRSRILLHAGLCDALQVSTRELKRTFSRVHDTVWVFENQMDQVPEIPSKPECFTLGWGGSKGHVKDLARVSPVILDFLETHSDAQFAFMGYEPHFRELYGSAPGARVHFRPPGSVEAYYDFLKGLHVGLAPLSDTEFNRCRSDVKFLEYAAHGVVPLVSDAAPYHAHVRHEVTGLLFGTLDELIGALNRLYDEPGFCQSLAERARTYVRDHRNALKHGQDRLTTYRSIMPSTSALATEHFEVPSCDGLMAHLRLAHQHLDEENFSAAAGLCDKALALFPSYAQAHVVRARAWLGMRQPERVLQTCGDVVIHPVYRDELRECLCQAAWVTRHPALEGLVKGLLSPIRQWRFLQTTGVDPTVCARKILSHARWDYESLCRAIVSDHESGDRVRLRQWLEAAHFIHPEASHFEVLLRQISD